MLSIGSFFVIAVSRRFGIGTDYKMKNWMGCCEFSHVILCSMLCAALSIWLKKPSQYICRGVWPLHLPYLTCCRSPLFHWCNTVKHSSKPIVDQWWLIWTQLLFYWLQTTQIWLKRLDSRSCHFGIYLNATIHQQIWVDVFLRSESASLCRLRFVSFVGKLEVLSIGVFSLEAGLGQTAFSHLWDLVYFLAVVFSWE